MIGIYFPIKIFLMFSPTPSTILAKARITCIRSCSLLGYLNCISQDQHTEQLRGSPEVAAYNQKRQPAEKGQDGRMRPTVWHLDSGTQWGKCWICCVDVYVFEENYWTTCKWEKNRGVENRFKRLPFSPVLKLIFKNIKAQFTVTCYLTFFMFVVILQRQGQNWHNEEI